MGDTVAQLTEQLRQASDARREAFRVGAGARTPDEARLSAGLRPGDRVFDTLSGTEGSVTAPPRSMVQPEAQVYVRLVDGRLVLRLPDALILRPALPTPRDGGGR